MSKYIYQVNLICFLVTFLCALVAQGSTPHSPISISSRTIPTTENGIVSGSGLIDDPYVISGWSIQLQSGTAIEVKKTSAYVIIQNCEIIGDGHKAIGILISNTPYVQVTGCKFTGLRTAIFIYQSPEVSATCNEISSCLRGIEATESDSLIINGNSILNANKHAIFLWRCKFASLSENTLKASGNGIYLDSCHYNTLEGNFVEDLNHSIFLWDCFHCAILKNTIDKCELGLAIVHTSENNVVFHNSFYNNARPASCDCIDNSWDGGYPTGGNFWQGQPMVDLFSGGDQNMPGSDGISDNPVNIPFQNLDHYPLMEQHVNKEQT